MKYMLLMNVPRGAGEYQFTPESAPEDFRAHVAYMHRLNKEMMDAGEWVDAQGLAPPNQARLVRAGPDGAPVTDGPFAETKDFLAGFWIVDVDGPERAYALAAKASAAPGPGGAPLNLPIEVRRVISGPPKDA